jgi:hypothetical protein
MTMNEPTPGTATQQIVRYAGSLARWFRKGRPVRSETEIIDIFEQKCRPCDDYNALTLSCRHCGCRVSTSVIAPLNKIAMQTEHCPLEKW